MILNYADANRIKSHIILSYLNSGGYVASDLVAVVTQAETFVNEMNSNDSSEEQLESIWSQSLFKALNIVAPSCLRGLTIKIPKVPYLILRLFPML